MKQNKVEVLLKQHLAVWNERDNLKRKAMIAALYTNDIELVEPYVVLVGRENLDSFISDLLAQNKDFVFRDKGIQAHHHIASLFWEFGPKSKPYTVIGQDVFLFKDEKIQKLYVFINGDT
jgi:hypothetical protein